MAGNFQVHLASSKGSPRFVPILIPCRFRSKQLKEAEEGAMQFFNIGVGSLFVFCGSMGPDRLALCWFGAAFKEGSKGGCQTRSTSMLQRVIPFVPSGVK